ncbi:MAG: hypothetical protein ACOYOU_00970 [Kiritimatiellia bacterium]
MTFTGIEKAVFGSILLMVILALIGLAIDYRRPAGNKRGVVCAAGLILVGITAMCVGCAMTVIK